MGPGVVATDAAGNVYAGDSTRIQKFTSSGGFITAWGRFGEGDGQFAYITDIATDASGNVYVTDHYYDSVQKFSSSGRFIGKWTNLVPAAAERDRDRRLRQCLRRGHGRDSEVHVQWRLRHAVEMGLPGPRLAIQGRWPSTRRAPCLPRERHVVHLAGRVGTTTSTVSSVDKFDSSGSPLTDWVVSSRRCGDSWWCLPWPDVLDVDRFGNVYVAKL